VVSTAVTGGSERAAIRAVVPADHESVLAFDPVPPKSGEHTEGLGHFWNGSAGARNGLEAHALVGWM